VRATGTSHEPGPIPTGVPSPRGRRWRGAAVDELGVVVFEEYGWSYSTVTGLLDATIVREDAQGLTA